MQKAIRKISVGEGDPNKMMHYQVGKEYTLSNVKYTLDKIYLDRELLELGKLSYNLYLKDKHGIILWKSITNIPMIIEYDINFK